MATSAKDSNLHVPEHAVRLVTSTALSDGHDAAINIMRRLEEHVTLPARPLALAGSMWPPIGR